MIIVDHTHLGRHVTGIERVTTSLFSRDSLDGLDATFVRSAGTLSMIWQQTVRLPALALRHPDAIIVCPGFPPSIPLTVAGGKRVVPYIHDLFLVTRAETLNRKAKLYMAPAFRFAISRLRRFLVNSRYTEDELRRFCRSDAEILLCRPPVQNVFGLSPRARGGGGGTVRIVMVGTIEPRKNYLHAARVREALERRVGRPVELHVVGRAGWGSDAEVLASSPSVVLHGYLDPDAARAVIGGADVFLSTSLDEGLGLPLLEAQYAGLPVVAPDMPVFREVLGTSGTFIPPDDVNGAAAIVATLLGDVGTREAFAQAALANVERWNERAEDDHARMLAAFADWTSTADRADAKSLAHEP